MCVGVGVGVGIYFVLILMRKSSEFEGVSGGGCLIYLVPIIVKYIEERVGISVAVAKNPKSLS